ncbi:MAG: hypothetical protein AB7E30_00525 [Lawsonibacter sp.]
METHDERFICVFQQDGPTLEERLLILWKAWREGEKAAWTPQG